MFLATFQYVSGQAAPQGGFFWVAAGSPAAVLETTHALWAQAASTREGAKLKELKESSDPFFNLGVLFLTTNVRARDFSAVLTALGAKASGRLTKEEKSVLETVEAVRRKVAHSRRSVAQAQKELASWYKDITKALLQEDKVLKDAVTPYDTYLESLSGSIKPAEFVSLRQVYNTKAASLQKEGKSCVSWEVFLASARHERSKAQRAMLVGKSKGLPTFLSSDKQLGDRLARLERKAVEDLASLWTVSHASGAAAGSASESGEPAVDLDVDALMQPPDGEPTETKVAGGEPSEGIG
jgi:hypothetical protein